MSEPIPNKDHDPAQDGRSMAKQVGQAFQYWVWPKKPLSPFPKSGPGAQNLGANTQKMVSKITSRASKSTKASRSGKKHRPGSVNNFE